MSPIARGKVTRTFYFTMHVARADVRRHFASDSTMLKLLAVLYLKE